MKKILSPFAIIILLFLNYCADSSSTNDSQEWITALIKTYESEPIGNPPQSIWRYTYLNQTVYYVPAQCCDQFSSLFDSNGNVICAPDGGITGNGDEKCSDFFDKRENEKLIWRDNRQ